MIKLFQQAKHWQLFLGLMLPFFLMIPVQINLFSNLGNPGGPIAPALDFISLMPLIMLPPIIVIFGWHWSMGIGLQGYLPEGMRMRTGFLKLAIIFPLAYISLFMLGFVGVFTFDFKTGMDLGEFAWFPALIAIMVLSHLFSMFCMFYTIYQCAKVLKSVELQREARFGEFLGEFFLLWFNYIGVWILQPRVNRIANGELESPTEKAFGHYDN